ncbi:MAG: hypothetical protein Q9207_002511 [Kuettlingeria erythrocarpa]
MSINTISRPNGSDNKGLEHPTIGNFTSVASYNWLDDPNPTILVPGRPPTWSPPSLPQSIAPDTGFRFIDQNADRYPKSPLTPLFSSILHTHGTYPFETMDIISDRSPLRKLYAFAVNEPDLHDFRFGVSTFNGSGNKTTVVFNRMEKRTRDEYEGVTFHGYRSGFEVQYLRPVGNARGSRSHHRISCYEFGGLNFLVRSAVDGYLPNNAPASTPGVQEGNIVEEPKDLGFQEESSRPVDGTLEGGSTDSVKGKEKAHQVGDSFSHTAWAGGDTSGKEDAGLNIVSGSSAFKISHETLLELVARSKYSKSPFNIAAKMPDLYLSQTMNFVEAYHRNVGYRKATAGKPEGIFMLEDVKVTDLKEVLKKWEKDSKVVLARYLTVLGQILDIVRAGGKEGCWEVSYVGEGAGGDGDGLEVREMKDGSVVGLKQEMGRFFPSSKRDEAA